jgi:hypothetical protein
MWDVGYGLWLRFRDLLGTARPWPRSPDAMAARRACTDPTMRVSSPRPRPTTGGVAAERVGVDTRRLLRTRPRPSSDQGADTVTPAEERERWWLSWSPLGTLRDGLVGGGEGKVTRSGVTSRSVGFVPSAADGGDCALKAPGRTQHPAGRPEISR